MSIGNRLFISVLSVFLVFAATFIIFQHNRESEFKVNLLDARLQDYNGMMIESLPQLHQQTERAIDEYVQKHRLEGLRVTVINRQGSVVYDNMYKDYARTGNHLDRKEVKQARENGNGNRKKPRYPAKIWMSRLFVVQPCLTDAHFVISV